MTEEQRRIAQSALEGYQVDVRGPSGRRVGTKLMHTIRVRDERSGDMLPVEREFKAPYRFQTIVEEDVTIRTPLYDRYVFTLDGWEYTIAREQVREALAAKDWRKAVKEACAAGPYPKRKLAIDEEIYDRVDAVLPGGVKLWPQIGSLDRGEFPDILEDLDQEDGLTDDEDINALKGYNADFDIESGEFNMYERDQITRRIRKRRDDAELDKLRKLARKRAKERSQ